MMLKALGAVKKVSNNLKTNLRYKDALGALI